MKMSYKRFFSCPGSPIPKPAPKRSWGIYALLGTLLATGCASFSTNVERTTETATHLAFGAYAGWTNAIAQYPALNQYTGMVHEARLKFVASVRTADALNASYQTNGVDKNAVQAALATLLNNSSNLVWLVNYFRAQAP